MPDQTEWHSLRYQPSLKLREPQNQHDCRPAGPPEPASDSSPCRPLVESASPIPDKVLDKGTEDLHQQVRGIKVEAWYEIASPARGGAPKWDAVRTGSTRKRRFQSSSWRPRLPVPIALRAPRPYVGAMFAVDHVLVSDALLDAPFACNLSACLGGCCVVGDSGAPLEPDEREAVELALEVVRPRLRPEALAAIDQTGPWTGSEREGYAVSTVDDAECVFVVYEKGGANGRPVALCAIQQAFWRGQLEFEKPLSCHLYPIRVETYGEGEDAVEVVNVETIDLCRPALPHGRRTGTQLADFLARPLARRYGTDWVERFQAALAERRDTLGIRPETETKSPARTDLV